MEAVASEWTPNSFPLVIMKWLTTRKKLNEIFAEILRTATFQISCALQTQNSPVMKRMQVEGKYNTGRLDLSNRSRSFSKRQNTAQRLTIQQDCILQHDHEISFNIARAHVTSPDNDALCSTLPVTQPPIRSALPTRWPHSGC